MSRALTSLPIVKPTISSSGLKTKASSGSGTHQRVSRRTRIGCPGPTTRLGRRLEEQLRTRGPVNPIVKRGRLFGLLLASDLAPLVSHPRTPNLLIVKRRQYLNRIASGISPTRTVHATFNLSDAITCVQEFSQASMAGGEWDDGVAGHEPDARESGSSSAVNLMSCMVLRRPGVDVIWGVRGESRISFSREKSDGQPVGEGNGLKSNGRDVPKMMKLVDSADSTARWVRTGRVR